MGIDRIWLDLIIWKIKKIIWDFLGSDWNDLQGNIGANWKGFLNLEWILWPRFSQIFRCLRSLWILISWECYIKIRRDNDEDLGEDLVITDLLQESFRLRHQSLSQQRKERLYSANQIFRLYIVVSYGIGRDTKLFKEIKGIFISCTLFSSLQTSKSCSFVIGKMAQLLANKGKGVASGAVPVRDFGKISAQMAAARDSSKIIRTETVKVASLDVSRRIKQFSLTMIGRAWNPRVQNMEDLIRLLPKILKMEGKVIAVDLGLGKFQLNFEEEKDIDEVLQNEPYHFDSWMVSMVKWEPIVSSMYPSTLTFWVQVVDIPFHYWAEETIRMVGNVLGNVKEVDEASGSVQVTINGFNPLVFKTVIPFDNGDEIEVSLVYEKLTGFCTHCFRISHDKDFCPDLVVVKDRKMVDSGDRGDVSNQQGGVNRVEKQWNPSFKRSTDMNNGENRLRTNYREVSDRERFHHKRGAGQTQNNWDNKRGKIEDQKMDRYKVGKAETSHGYGKDARIKKGMVVPRVNGGASAWPLPLYQGRGEQSCGKNGHDINKNIEGVSHGQLVSDKQEINTDWTAILADPTNLSTTMEDDDLLLEDGELSKTPLTRAQEKELEAFEMEIMKEVEKNVENQLETGGLQGTGAHMSSYPNAPVNEGMVALLEPPGHP